MNCQKCGRQSVPGAKFCLECGSPLELPCPACQNANEPGSRYCGLCGQRLTADAAPQRPINAIPFQRPRQTVGVGAAEDATPQPRPGRNKDPAGPDASTRGQESLRPDKDTHEEPRPGSVEELTACPRCHQENLADADYCFACGLPFSDPGRPALSSDAPAGFVVRMMAYLGDLVVVLLLMFVLDSAAEIFLQLPSVGNPSEDLDSVLFGNAFLPTLLLCEFAYATVSVGSKATTAGKRVLSLYVVRTDGSRVGYRRALARHAVRLLSQLTLGIVLFLVLALRKDKRGLHDLICDTKVVRGRVPRL